MSVSLVNASWLLFFFKQKTAYEMRISDWSSDVCSSDLLKWVEQTAIRVKLLDKDGAPLRHLRRVLKMSELVKRQPPGHWVQTERAAHEAWASLIEKAPKAAQLMHILTARVGEHNAVVISQKTLAALMKCSRRTVQRAEIGRAHVSTTVTIAHIVC